MTDSPSPVRLEALLAHRAWVRAVARALVADPNQADEIEKETWLAAMRHPPRHAASPRGWLGAVARNVARRLGRDAACRERHETGAGGRRVETPATDLVAEAELQQRIGRAVLALDEPFRSTVLLRYFDGLPPRDVAARLGVPVETVRSRLRRAHERLRAELDAADGDRRGAWVVAVLAWRNEPPAPLPLAPAAGTTALLGGVVMKKIVAAAAAVLLVTASWLALSEPNAGEPPSPRNSAEESTSSARAGDPAAAPRRASRQLGETAVVESGAGDELPQPVDLDRADRDLDLHGTVAGLDGRPVAGARVATFTYPWRTANLLNVGEYDRQVAGPATRSARDGTFSLRLARGQSVALRVAAQGFASTEITQALAGERLRVTLRQCVRLIVELTDADGAPVAGARLDVRSTYVDRDLPSFHVTGSTGRVGVGSVEGLPAGRRARLQAVHPEKGSGWVWELTLPASGELRHELRIPAARVIRGRVTDAVTRSPIAGASVGMNWTLDEPVTTDDDGRYELPGWTGEGVSDVHVRAEGYAGDGKVVGAAERIDFELARGYAASGRVVGPEGQPIAGAQVSLVAAPMGDHEEQISSANAESDADGRFRVTSLRPGMRHVVVVLAAGYARLRRETPTASSTSEMALGDLVLAVPRRVEGVVVGADGSPLQRQEVILSGPGTGDDVGSFYGRSVESATDDLGRFRFTEVGPGDYEVVVRPAGAQELRKRVIVPPDKDVLDVRVERAATREITVSITDVEGEPLTGAVVALTNSDNSHIQAPVDANGVARVTVPAVRAMTWSVYPPQRGERTFLQPAWVPLPRDRDAFTVALEEAAYVTGKVVDEGGAPVEGAWLQLIGRDGDVRYAETDAEGRFRAMVRKASRSVLVFDGGVNVSGTRQDSGLAARIEEVAAGADVVVRCTRVAQDKTLTVVVVTPNGDPVAGASVGVLGPNVTVSKGVWPRTDEAGRVAFKDLPARSLRVHARVESAEFREPSPATVVPEGQELRLVCRMATRITGVVVDKSGRPLPHGSARATRDEEYVTSAQIDSEGRFTLLVLDTDTLPVRVVIERDVDQTPEATLDGVAPGSRDVRLVVDE
jgi:RNA polymerase sigma factor (sigma-70 family)